MGTYSRKLYFTLALLLAGISFVMAQQKITGVVTDAEEGIPLPGVTVLLKSTNKGTTTDIDGKYQITVPSGETLLFSFVGYETVEIPVENQSTINVALETQATELDEVVLIGYGVQKKRDKTGAVAQVKAEELNQGVLTDAVQSIQGKTSGVSITKKGGDPNAGFSVKIRGASGLVSGTDPLYVVDGIPGVDPTTIAPEDIASFDVLKDASSTAIYGSRGANGVIIITTKDGEKNQDTEVSFNTYAAVESVAKRLDMLSADELRNYADTYNLNLNDGGADTDWQDAIFRNALTQSYNLAASGGSEKGTYRISLGHKEYEGVIIGTQKERTSARINLTQEAMDGRLHLNSSLAATFENNDYVNYGGSGPMDVLYQAFQRNPTDPIYNEEGEYYEIQRDFNYNNPVALANEIDNTRKAKRFVGQLRADFDLTDHLTATANLGYIRDDSESTYFEPTYLLATNYDGYGKRNYDNAESKILELFLTYKRAFGSHNLEAFAAYSYQEDNYDGFHAQGRSPNSNYLGADNLGTMTEINFFDIGSYRSQNLLISFFGRAVYNYDNRYYLTATLRRDGSSKFGTNNEWALFPSATVAWNMKSESFLQNVSFLDQLKLRVGYGLSGNQEIAAYNDVKYYTPTSGINPNTGEPDIAFNLSHSGNPDLKWEENKEFNVGIDFGLFDNQISGSIEYYNKITYDLLNAYNVPVPPYPTSTIWANAGEISNQGLELNLQAYPVSSTNFEWKTLFNISRNVQKVNSLSSDEFEWAESDKKQGWLSGRGLVGDQNWTQLVDEGYALGTFYMPEYAGLSSDGKFLFYTAAGGVTRDVAAADRRVVGNALPEFEIGWSNFYTFYQNFDFGFSLRFVYGFDVLNVTRMVFANPNILPTLNALSEVVDEKERGLDDAPKVNSYYLEDGTFLKLDNVTLGYTFENNKLPYIKSLRVYFTSNNLLTLTGYSGLDPEISYNGTSFGLDMYDVYPKTRSFTVGLNVTF
ncbi:MAG: SusC/RagA family TonB-linked outer membrane protein [Bacteroidota bacterium]